MEHNVKHSMEYELIYRDGRGGTLRYSFPDDIDLNELKERLEYFLLASSWCPETIQKLFGDKLD